MPPGVFFSRFGFFVRPDFLDSGSCAAIRAEMRTAPGEPGRVDRGDPRVDETVRRVDKLHVSAETKDRISESFKGLVPTLVSHFGIELGSCAAPQFLRYRPGHFYEPHRDNSPAPLPDATRRERQVSVTVFLNGPADQPTPEHFGGGALTFYGLLDGPRANAVGLPLVGEEGLLVAFRSETLHSVEFVTHGERYTLVTWVS